MTRIRLFIARIIYILLHAILKRDKHRILRKGVIYEVDISEGIDLSLFVFGNFQKYVFQSKLFSLPQNAIVFDIGANIGSMTFRFSQVAPDGHVYAFEPTNYAFHKLKQNLALNPELARRITPIQRFVSSRSGIDHDITAYASWKLSGDGTEKHPLHGGQMKSAISVPAITIDDYCLENKIKNVNLIKIDTDGHEFEVLKGASITLSKFRPCLIFEIGLYVLKEQKISFTQFFEYLATFGYTLYNIKNRKKITLDNYTTQIPALSTTDILAIPAKGPKR